jgi:spore maturation protein CgeB
MNIVILGLSITSSWGNGHATTFRALVRGLDERGHRVTFLERDRPWYATHRDLVSPPYCQTHLYDCLGDLSTTYATTIAAADLVVVGSYVPDGIEVVDLVQRLATGVTAFYDVDTPITMRALEDDASTYIARRQMPAFDLYLSFTGGPILQRLEREYQVKRARALYCAVDVASYYKDPSEPAAFDLGYLGTYSPDRQPALERLLLEPAAAWPDGRFVVAGAQYPDDGAYTANVLRLSHVAPADHRAFYNRQRFTLNLTRRDMIEAGYSPSVRLFEAAACGTPVISDDWPGLSTILTPGREILIARSGTDVLGYLRDLPETERTLIGVRAQQRVLASHTALHRAAQLERYAAEVTSDAAAPPEARTA